MAVVPQNEISALERLLTAPTFGLSADEKDRLLRAAVSDEVRFHANASEFYRDFCAVRGFDPSQELRSLADVPPMPVQGFKEVGSHLSAVPKASVRTVLTSSATSGTASTVFIDQETSRRQVRALAQVMQAVLGPKRRPFWVIDAEPRPKAGELSARGAATRGFLSVSTSSDYLLTETPSGLVLNESKLDQLMTASATSPKPICVFGFTYVIYSTLIEPLRRAGRQLLLPVGSTLVHIGGWKKLRGLGVSDDEFRRAARAVFGCEVTDIYGFTEQIGVLYPECSVGRKHAPAFSEVIVRDPVSLEAVPDGTLGVLEFVTPVPHSYAGAAVLTDDLGIIESRDLCACGWKGTAFRVMGRTQNVELRGCGDVLAEKVARPLREASPSAGSQGVKLIFDTSERPKPFIFDASDSAIDGLAHRLRAAQQRLSEEKVDNLVSILSAAAAKWASPDHPLANLRQHGLSFLSQWCRADRLHRSIDSSLGFSRLALDGFVAEADTRRLIRAQPRGLSVHWLAGNAPTIGLLSALMCVLAKNSCLLKAPIGQDSALPQLLDDISDVRMQTMGGRELSGTIITDAIAVLQFGREERSVAEQLSALADIRIAWGGAEAVHAVMHMPRHYGAEDLIFGPRLSLMVIGRNEMADVSRLRQLARKAAVDVSAFDQYACASPHVVFVEKGGKLEPREFAALLAGEMDRVLARLPKTTIDGGVASRIQSLRMRQQLRGGLWCSKGLEWTVVFGETVAMPDPVYSRTIFVVAVDDVNQVIPLVTPQHQTIGLALDGPRRLRFANQVTARGVDRLPDVGHMTDFDVPWDGMRQMSRLVRWVTIGAPL